MRYMKIGLLSDTHSYLDPQLFDCFAHCDELWHAGDWGSLALAEELAAFKPLVGVYGNIDGREIRELHPEEQYFERGGLRIRMLHIGGYPGRYPKALAASFLEKPCDVFICGHSHILKIMPDERYQFLHINPGACGREGWHKMRTALRFDIEDGRIKNLELLELGLRGAL